MQRHRTARRASFLCSGTRRASDVLRWSGDGAHVEQFGGRLVVRRGLGVDEGAQQQSALQLQHPRGQRCEVLDARPGIEHGARRDIQGRLPDLRNELGGTGRLGDPGRTRGALRPLGARQAGRASGTRRALHALETLQAGEAGCARRPALTLLPLQTRQPLLTLLAGLTDHTALALQAAEALEALLTLLAGETG